MRTRLTVTAGVVIIALTGAAFWLSYAHLHDVAATHGLGTSPARAWAWPATLDLFIVAGEIMMLVAALAKRRDFWAIGLTVAGSVGSIGLNVYGVGADAPKIEYLVAAVPPSAALLAFGALMRQVHHALAGEEEAKAEPGEALTYELQGDRPLSARFMEPLEEYQAAMDEVVEKMATEAGVPLELVKTTATEDASDSADEDEDSEEEVPVYTISSKPTLAEIDAAIQDIRKEGRPLSGGRLAKYFGVSGRTGRRYLSEWSEAQESTA
nr:DUF2637 domain-containing protein [Streptomyces viridochromogenes]